MYRALALLTESIWACGPCASLHAHYFAHVHALGKGREAERITSTEERITSEGHHVFLTNSESALTEIAFLIFLVSCSGSVGSRKKQSGMRERFVFSDLVSVLYNKAAGRSNTFVCKRVRA